MYKVCVIHVKGVQYGLRVCRCAVQAVVNFLLCTLQPALYTLSLYCTPSAYTAHTVYQVITIVFIGMPSLDTSNMQNKIIFVTNSNFSEIWVGFLVTLCKLSSSCLEAFPKYAMSWLSPPSNEVLVSKCLVNWCEISNLHKFNLEFQKYHIAEQTVIPY